MPRMRTFFTRTIGPNSINEVKIPNDRILRLSQATLSQMTPMNTKVSLNGKLKHNNCEETFNICNLFGISHENQCIKIDLPSDSILLLTVEGKHPSKKRYSLFSNTSINSMHCWIFLCYIKFCTRNLSNLMMSIKMTDSLVGITLYFTYLCYFSGGQLCEIRL